MTERLTPADVQKLLSDPSAEARVETTVKVAQGYSGSELSANERKIAEDILRALSKDVEVRVREALAAHIKAAPNLPHDLALTLARDVDSVALPVLKFSEVLTDADLIELLRGPSAAKQEAIAQRPTLSDRVSDAVIETGNETAVARLVANEGARISEKAFSRVMERYGGSEAISDTLARRPNLPAAISEQLVGALSQRLHEFLVNQRYLDPDTASTLIIQARERATVSLLDGGSNEEELERLVEQLAKNNRLSASIVLRALCVGDLSFVEAALARLAKVPVQNARILIHDQGSLGMESLYNRCGLPEKLFPAFRAAIEVVRENEYDGGQNDRERFVGRTLERILTRFEDPSSRLAPSDIDFLMKKLKQIAA